METRQQTSSPKQEEKNHERFISILALAAAFVSLFLIGFCIGLIPFSTDTSALNAVILPDILETFAPEPNEKAQYMLLTILFPFLFMGFYTLFRRSVKTTPAPLTLSKAALAGFAILLALIIALLAANPYYYESLKASNLGFGLTTWIVCAEILLMMILLIKGKPGRVSRCLFLGGVLALDGYLVWLYLTPSYYAPAHGMSYQSYHFTGYFYSIYKVFSGQTIGIDFRNLYGFYGYVLAPLLAAFGTVNELYLSAVMAALMLIISSALFFAVYKIFDNKLLGFVSGIAALFLSVPHLTRKDSFYLLMDTPNRKLFPFLAIGLFALALQRENGKKLWFRILMFLVCAAALFWNIETGMVVLISWCGLQIYQILLEQAIHERKTWRQILRVVLSAFLTAALALGAIYLVTWQRSHIIPPIRDLFFGPLVAYGSGYYMVPMPLFHPWLLLVLVYALALAHSLKKLHFMSPRTQAPLSVKELFTFILPIMGLGLFSYYQGRSVNVTFGTILWPGVLLCGMKADDLLQKLPVLWANRAQREESPWQLVNAVLRLGLLTLLTSALAFTCLMDLSCVFDPQNESPFKLKGRIPQENYVYRYSVSIKRYRKDHEEQPVAMVLNDAATIASFSHEKLAAALPTQIDWFTYDDIRQIIDFLAAAEMPFAIDRPSLERIYGYLPDEMSAVMQRYTPVEGYTAEASDLLLFEPL